MAKTSKKQIIESFIKLAARRGLDPATMVEIARHCCDAGVQPSALYKHFTNKSALINDSIKHCADLEQWGPAHYKFICHVFLSPYSKRLAKLGVTTENVIESLEQQIYELESVA